MRTRPLKELSVIFVLFFLLLLQDSHSKEEKLAAFSAAVAGSIPAEGKRDNPLCRLSHPGHLHAESLVTFKRNNCDYVAGSIFIQLLELLKNHCMFSRLAKSLHC